MMRRPLDFSHIYVATRFFERDRAKVPARLAKLEAFVDAMLALGVGGIGIAVNVDVDCSEAIDHLNSRCDEKVNIFAVTPWGMFMPALEALLKQASVAGFSKLLCVSVEVEIDTLALTALDNEVSEATLVAGLRMQGHQFKLGENTCNGEHSPWNTAALWRIRNGLDRIGFASSGEAHADPTGENAGVEEVSTIAIYQKLYADCSAVLIHTDEVAWDTDRSSRPDGLGKKLRTKNPRAAWQLEHAGLEPGRVHHKELRAGGEYASADSVIKRPEHMLAKAKDRG
jgi:hypothetical protein